MSDESKKYVGEFIAARLNELLADNKVKSRKTLSQLTGHGENLVSNLVNQKYNPTVVSIYDLCEFFGITLSDFFQIDYSKDKSAEAFLEMLKKEYEPEDITMMYDVYKNIGKDKMKAVLSSYSDYYNAKEHKK
ncbi:helix-turn-helix domain-containing protein [Christensenella tenuis]|jgi:transcriptional regulator with XRE-family HTH domain|uniref:Helix-turn-helix transcriptional regulator n=1 Tax=Christensenella tenuis TaxID=2763033 RepID=A0ABR7EGM5_9FIRM|nr:helix-turn-helix transcriptional regulator [Christensenella tenuis]MBC5648899.1 helix-turn-helix transcriptional regulator [Christensenella tenuis]